MELYCKACGQSISGDDLNAELAVASCRACHALSSVPADTSNSTPRRPPVGLPKHLRLDSDGPDLTITHTWYSVAAWVIAFFCVFAGLSLYPLATIVRHIPWEALLAPAVVFCLMFIPTAAGLLYFVASLFLNKTVVRIANCTLTVDRGPLPWPGNRCIPTSDIKQLFCTANAPIAESGGERSYNVDALKGDGTRLRLVYSLDLVQALFVEEQIEQHLKIRDEPVAGQC